MMPVGVVEWRELAAFKSRTPSLMLSHTQVPLQVRNGCNFLPLTDMYALNIDHNSEADGLSSPSLISIQVSNHK
jgi:hypothetical protein